MRKLEVAAEVREGRNYSWFSPEPPADSFMAKRVREHNSHSRYLFLHSLFPEALWVGTSSCEAGITEKSLANFLIITLLGSAAWLAAQRHHNKISWKISLILHSSHKESVRTWWQLQVFSSSLSGTRESCCQIKWWLEVVSWWILEKIEDLEKAI